MPESATNADAGQQTQKSDGTTTGGANPPPVPYPAFKELNDKYKALETEFETYKTANAEFGKSKFESLQNDYTREKTGFQTKLALAREGVTSDAYLDYLTSRYNSLPDKERPNAGDWAKSLRTSEPAFFGSSGVGQAGAAGATSTTTTTTTSPKTNPDANAKGSDPNAADPPITDEYLKGISQADFNRRFSEIDKYLASKKRR
jgi:hypothetical protein